MNLSILRAALVLPALLFFSCGSPEDPTANPNNQSALAEIKKEEKVKEAMITSANVLYVAVEDDGTPRDGYAQYLCQILSEHKSTVKGVKVVKVGTAGDPNADNAFGVLLGESHCK